ncbi:MAG: hypothetical protein AB7V39_21490, partial [Nitrospiraceae bacterium]
NALSTLGERESGTQRLNEAVTAYHNALLEHTRERAPLQWAMTQNNLGNALRALRERESGTQSLNDAITAYHNALLEHTRARVPLQWAYVQHGLANTLDILAKRQNSAARMREAITCMREAATGYQLAGESYWLPIAETRITEMEGEVIKLQQ